MSLHFSLECLSSSETDLDNVLQSNEIFSNVSKGETAARDDLKKIFKTDDTNAIILDILKKGDLQVSEKEREHTLSNLTKDVAAIICAKTVNPTTNRPYTITMIEKMMTDLHVNLNPNKNAKAQALEIIKVMSENGNIPIMRASMRIRVYVNGKEGKKVKEKIVGLFEKVEEEEYESGYDVTGLIDPGNFRIISDHVGAETKGRGQVEVLNVERDEKDEIL